MQRLIIAGVALTLIIAIFLPVYGATEPMRQEAARERLQEEARVRGGETYGAHCVSCHGADGEGTIGPAVNNLPHEAAALESGIAGGVAGTAMPAFAKDRGGALGPHQITDLALFLSHWDASLVASEAPHDAPEAPSGDAAQATFEEKCGACHSIGGGRGVGPDLKDVTARRDRDWLIQFIVSPEQLIARDAAARQLVAEYMLALTN